MRTVASIVVVVHAVCATLLGGPAAAAGLDGVHGRRMLADSLAQARAPLDVTGADSSCGHLDEPPCPNTGCANALKDIGGVCKSAKFMNSYDGSGGMEDELDNGVGMGRYLLQLQRRERARGSRDQPPSSNAPRTRTGKRAPRRARPADPVRTRTGKRAPRRARPADPVRTRTGKRAPRRARPTDPVRTRNGKRAPRRARPTDPRRRSRNGKDTLARPSKPSRGRNSKRSPSPARVSRPARGRSGKGSSAQAPRRSSRTSHSHHSKGHGGHDHHSRRHGHPSKGHRSHGHHSHGHHSHSHHGTLRDSNGPSTFKRFSSGHEGKGEGSDSTVYVKGDVGTLFVTSTGDGYIGVSPHSGQYGVSPHSGQYGVTYVQYHGAPEVHDPPHLAPTVPSPPQQHRLRHAW